MPLLVWLGFWKSSHTTQLWAWSLMEWCIVYDVWFLPLCPSLIFFSYWPISIIFASFRVVHFWKLIAQGKEKDFSCLPEGKKSAVALTTAGQPGDTCFPKLWHGLSSFGYQADQKKGKMWGREGHDAVKVVLPWEVIKDLRKVLLTSWRSWDTAKEQKILQWGGTGQVLPSNSQTLVF